MEIPSELEFRLLRVLFQRLSLASTTGLASRLHVGLANSTTQTRAGHVGTTRKDTLLSASKFKHHHVTFASACSSRSLSRFKLMARKLSGPSPNRPLLIRVRLRPFGSRQATRPLLLFPCSHACTQRQVAIACLAAFHSQKAGDGRASRPPVMLLVVVTLPLPILCSRVKCQAGAGGYP